MRAEDRAVAEIAASVADGAPVDWATVETRVPAAHLRLIRHLRLVESISTLYRTLPSESDEEIATSPRLPDGPRWGSLVLLDRIGTGTSCDVYKALDSSLHRDVALKLLKDDPLAKQDGHSRVLEEARRLARVRHQHVVQVYGAEEHDGRVGLWMELVSGESLEQIVKTRGPYGASEAALVGQQLCAALAAVHGAGLLHRDVKAQNVLRESGGRIVLMDFGTGEELRTNAGTNRLVGTPLYLAPEIFRGRAASVQSDLYSLGVLLFYLVTGEFPVTAGTMEGLARAHAASSMRRLRDVRPDLPDGFVAAVERALEPVPSRRYRSAGEFETALRHLQRVPNDGDRSQAPRSGLAHWVRVLPAAALVLIVVGLIVWSGIGFGPSATRLAVLPFTHGPGADAPVVADALTDQLIATLGQIESLQVIDRSSSERFQNSPDAPGAIASTLGVDAVLQPDVTIVRGADAKPRARVAVRLIAAGTGATMWTRTFERDLGATSALLADVARGVSQNVNASLRPNTARRLDRLPPTSQAAAEAYFQGLHYLKRLSPDETRLAIASFQRAIEFDPLHAPALAGLARGYVDLGLMGAITHAEARAVAQAQIERALELDRDSSEAHVVTADLKFYYDWDWRGADQEYERAIALNGSSAHGLTQYARYLAAAGRLDLALEQANRAFVLNPLSSSAASTVALIHLFGRDYQAALHASDQAVQLDPASAGAHIVRARILTASNATPQAIAATQTAISLSRHAPPGWRAHLIALHAQEGRRDEARTAMNRLMNELQQQNERMGAMHLAYIELALSGPAAALDLVERAVEERSSDILWFAVDPRVDALRGHPRFERVLAKVAGQ